MPIRRKGLLCEKVSSDTGTLFLYLYNILNFIGTTNTTICDHLLMWKHLLQLRIGYEFFAVWAQQNIEKNKKTAKSRPNTNKTPRSSFTIILHTPTFNTQ